MPKKGGEIKFFPTIYSINYTWIDMESAWRIKEIYKCQYQ